MVTNESESIATAPLSAGPVSPLEGVDKDTASDALTPIQVLVTSLAYIIDADSNRHSEEKAEIVTLLNKHVSRGEFTDRGLADLVQFAFTHSKKQSLDKFLEDVTPKLSNMQMASIYMNVLEVMIVDGTVREAEQNSIKKFQDAFHLDHETVLAIRELIFVKNDTRMFLYPEHPRNSNEEFLSIALHRRDVG